MARNESLGGRSVLPLLELLQAAQVISKEIVGGAIADLRRIARQRRR
jgi:hypothetical protein